MKLSTSAVVSLLICAVVGVPAPAQTRIENGASAAPLPTSLIQNGDFSRGLESWGGTLGEGLAASVVPTTDAPANTDISSALQLDARPQSGANSWSLRWNQDVLAAIPIGSPVVFSGWMRSPQSLRTAVFLTDKDNNDNRLLQGEIALSPTWKRVELRGRAPKNIAANRSYLEFHVGYGAGQIQIAGVFLTAEPAPPSPLARDFSHLVFPRVAVSRGSLSKIVDTTKITGAHVDESKIQVVLRATPATLRAVLQIAYTQLKAGRATKIVFAPGVYRLTAPRFDWLAGHARDAVWVMQAEKPGTAIWSGADVFPLSGWKSEGDGLFSHAWNFKFGMIADPWGPPKTIGHRAEMLFVNGLPLRQIELETYTAKGMGVTWDRAPISYDYMGALDPKTALKVGEFGVFERAENGERIWFRAPKGAVLRRDSVEVSTRQTLLDLSGKRNLVVRGLVFERVASQVKDNQQPLTWNWNVGSPSNVLIDGCTFRWNNLQGLQFGGGNWTIRDSKLNFNGGSGISAFGAKNVVFERNQTDFNNWRIYAGGERGWSFGGVKVHQMQGLKVVGHEAIGNLTAGFWCDIHCKNVWMQDAVLIDNNLQWELGQGPYAGRHLLIAANAPGVPSVLNLWNVGRVQLDDSVLWNASPGQNAGAVIGLDASDRADPDALKEKISFQGFEWNRNLLVSGSPTTPLIRERDSRDSFNEGFVPYHFRGVGNLYFVPASGSLFVHQNDERLVSNVGLASWQAARFHADGGQVVATNPLPNAANYDFRSRFANLPQWKMSAARRAQLNWFAHWMPRDAP